MRLLIITQKIDRNDSVLGFFHRWVEEFAKHFETITVICLYKGEYNFPENVHVFSLGKEQLRKRTDLGNSKRSVLEEQLRKVRYVFNFYRLIWRERKNYDAVFVHMNQVYVILGGILWRVLGKKIALWYAHGKISFSLRAAEKIAHIIITSTPGGFRLPSQKAHIVGQGIDTDYFTPREHLDKEKSSTYMVITIGRLSPVKDYETIIGAIELLKRKNFLVRLEIVGGAGTADQEIYVEALKNLVREKRLDDRVFFMGAISHHDLLPNLQKADLFVNMSHTGSLDKAILEAMAAGLPVITCNEAATDVFKEFKNLLLTEKKNPLRLAERIQDVLALTFAKKNQLTSILRERVQREHSLGQFAMSIKKIFETTV